MSEPAPPTDEPERLTYSVTVEQTTTTVQLVTATSEEHAHRLGYSYHGQTVKQTEGRRVVSVRQVEL